MLSFIYTLSFCLLASPLAGFVIQGRSHQTIHFPLYATKIAEWKVLSSGCLTGESDGTVITTSPLQNPDQAKPGATVVTASGSKYQLTGEPQVGSKVYPPKPIKTPVPPVGRSKPTPKLPGRKTDEDSGFLLLTISAGCLVAALAASGPGNSSLGAEIDPRDVALAVYTVIVAAATKSLVSEALDEN